MRKLLLLFILSLMAFSSNAQWVTQATAFTAASRGVQQIFIVDPNTVWITAYDGTGASTKCRDYSRTSDGGATWISGTVPAPSNNWSWSCITAVSSDTAWALLFQYTSQYTGRVYQTTDGGTTWTQQGAGDIFTTNSKSFPDVIYFWDANTGMALGDPINGEFEIYTTSDGGFTWSAVNGSSIADPTSGETGLTASFCVRNGIIYCGTTDGRVLKSTDKGQTWTAFSTGYSGYLVPKPVFANENLGWCQIYHVTPLNVIDDRQLVRTMDSGTTWTTVSPTGPYHYGSISYVPGTTMTLVSTGIDATNGDLGSSYSLDGGDSWVEIDTGVQHGEVQFYDNTTGWCGGFNTDQYTDGIFKYDGSFIADGISNPDVTSKFNLYPNPSEGLFYFSFDAQNNLPIHIHVTDAMGKTIFDKVYKDKSQTWLRSIDLRNFSQGIYFLDLENNGNHSSQKLIIN